MGQSRMRYSHHAGTVAACSLIAALFAPAPAAAQQPAPSPQPPLRTTLPPITVTAQKEPDDPQKLPVSVTAVSNDTLENAGIRSISEASVYAPNTFFNEFTARKLSNARFRGIQSMRVRLY